MSILAFLRSACILILIPALVGNTIAGITHIGKRPCYRYIMGFLGMLTIAYITYIPFVLTRRSFHRYFQVYLIELVLVMLLGLTLYGKELWMTIRNCTMAFFAFMRKHPWVMFLFLFFLWQCWRAWNYTQVNYSDDDTYIPLVNDILLSDQFFRVNWSNGEMLSPKYTLDAKYLYTGWFPFQAILCKFVGVHPLIMVKSIFPMALIALHYVAIWNLVCSFGNLESEEGCPYFFLFYGILMEVGWSVLTTSWSYYFLTWIWYGKAFLHLIVMPLLLAHLLRFDRKKLGHWSILVLLILSGVGASTMGLLLIPAELALYTVARILDMFWKRRRAVV